MAPEYDPVVGFARAAESMAETQRLALRTIRGLAWLQGFACVMIGLALCGLGVVLWYTIGHAQAHAAQTQALIELLRRSSGR